MISSTPAIFWQGNTPVIILHGDKSAGGIEMEVIVQNGEESTKTQSSDRLEETEVLQNGIECTSSLTTMLASSSTSKSISLGDRLGLQYFSSSKVWRASSAELLGSAALVFMIDTIIISSNQAGTNAPKMLMSILIAITVAILVLATLPVSGGHINPTVSLSVALTGVISPSRALIYIIAQCTGGVLGALALKVVLTDAAEEAFSLGGCTTTVVTPGPLGPVVSQIATKKAFFLETICSFIFLFASRWVALDQRQANVVGRVIVCSVIGVSAGLNVFVSTTLTGIRGYSGAGTNPARCLGPAVVRGGHLWDNHWIYWVGPGIASLGFYLYVRIIPDDHFVPSPPKEKHDALNVVKAAVERVGAKYNALKAMKGSVKRVGDSVVAEKDENDMA